MLVSQNHIDQEEEFIRTRGVKLEYYIVENGNDFQVRFPNAVKHLKNRYNSTSDEFMSRRKFWSKTSRHDFQEFGYVVIWVARLQCWMRCSTSVLI